MIRLDSDLILKSLDFENASIPGQKRVERYLADVRGSFADTQAYEAALAEGNPLLYAVAGVEPPDGPGQLHYGLGVLYPGKIGNEYYLTKGHYHSVRDCAEVYVGLKGKGAMLLEDGTTGESRMVSLGEREVVYVPGNTAHRTVNTGSEPLVYVGIYPSNAGHDYGSIARNNFRMVIVEEGGKPVMKPRAV